MNQYNFKCNYRNHPILQTAAGRLAAFNTAGQGILECIEEQALLGENPVEAILVEVYRPLWLNNKLDKLIGHLERLRSITNIEALNVERHREMSLSGKS